jgi:hypothetical protein
MNPDRMSDVALYFIIFGILLLGYFIFRVAIAADFSVNYMRRRRYTFKEYIRSMRGFKCGPFILDGKSIQTTELSNRIQHVREELTQGKTPERPASFKRAIAVESKRAEIAKLAFFEPHPPVKPISQDPEDGFHLLMV